MANVLKLYGRLGGSAPGRWLFTRAVCWTAPYFGSIRPMFEVLEPGYCKVSMRKRRSVTNHIGTVHAIAGELPVQVEVRDRAGEVVVAATIRMWLSQKRSA